MYKYIHFVDAFERIYIIKGTNCIWFYFKINYHYRSNTKTYAQCQRLFNCHYWVNLTVFATICFCITAFFFFFKILNH